MQSLFEVVRRHIEARCNYRGRPWPSTEMMRLNIKVGLTISYIRSLTHSSPVYAMPDNLPIELIDHVFDHVNHAPVPHPHRRRASQDVCLIITQAMRPMPPDPSSSAPPDTVHNHGLKNSPKSGPSHQSASLDDPATGDYKPSYLGLNDTEWEAMLDSISACNSDGLEGSERRAKGTRMMAWIRRL